MAVATLAFKFYYAMDEESIQERERWRGTVSSDLITIKSNITTLFRLNETFSIALQTLSLQVNTIATKIAAYAAIGGFIGGGLMALIVSYITTKK